MRLFKNVLSLSIVAFTVYSSQSLAGVIFEAGPKQQYTYKDSRALTNGFGLLDRTQTIAFRPTKNPELAVRVQCYIVHEGALNYEGSRITLDATFFPANVSRQLSVEPTHNVKIWSAFTKDTEQIELCKRINLQIQNASYIKVTSEGDKTELQMDSGSYTFSK